MLKYWAILKTQWLTRMTYIGDLVTQSLSIMLFLWIFLQLWRVTYRSVGQETINGLSLNDTLWYLMIAEAVVLSKPRTWRAISDAVKDGSIAYLLNKPYNFLLYQFSVGLGDALSALGFNLLAGGALVWLSVGAPPALYSLPMVIVAMILGWAIDFCFSALIGLAAFVSEEVAPLDWLYSKALFVLGGLFIPLDFFPDWLRGVATSLPFAYTLYGPARLFVTPSWQRFGELLLGQAAWLAALGLLVTVLYHRGTARLTINGG